MLAYAIAFATTFIILVLQWQHLGKGAHRIIIFSTSIILFPILTSFIGLAKGEYQTFMDVFIGWSRLIFVLPIYWVVIVMVRQPLGVVRVGRLVTWISFFAALTIPLQFMIGPIPWFAESSERSGLPRYASLFGSLTTLGVVNGAAILVAYFSFKSRLLTYFLVSGIIIGSVLSLQKAAILNILIATSLVLLIRRPRLKEVIVGLFSILLVALISFSFFGEKFQSYFNSIRILASSEAANSNDVSISESILDRITTLPAMAIHYHGADTLFYGVGPIGGAGAFGYPDVPMAHNGLVDILLIGGATYFFLFLFGTALCFGGSWRFFRKNANFTWSRVGFFCILIVLINIPFSGLIFFSPSAAMFLAYGMTLTLDSGDQNV